MRGGQSARGILAWLAAGGTVRQPILRVLALDRGSRRYEGCLVNVCD